MKNIAKIIASVLIFLITISIQAQTVSTSTSKSSSSTSTNSNSDDEGNFSYSHSSNDDKKSNVSISINNSDDVYSLRAKFPKEKYQEVKNILNDEMNKKNHSISKGKDYWNSDSNGEEVYEVSLSNQRISMYLDKEIASASLAEKFKNLGLNIRTVIAGKQNEARREAQRLQREADKLRRDAEYMHREAKRIEREAKRHTTSNQYRDDANKIADEARRLADRASNLNRKANHKGGISSYIRTLLNDSKTIYNENTQNVNNWTWPKAQKELLSNFKNDNLIHTENDVVFIKDYTGIYVNGKGLSKIQETKYNKILAKNKITKSQYFTFYKTNGNIAIVNNNANLDGLLSDLVSSKIIDSDRKKVKLELNGNTSYKNGNPFSTDVLKTLNSILLKNYIIPAPGKIFEIMKPENYKLGYSNGKRSHIGTWMITN